LKSKGIAFLTMDKMVLKALRKKAGVHIDNYVKSSWGGDQGGWKWEKVVD
jgi:hypothetical protein